MKRKWIGLFLILAAALTARAHFVFVVPQDGGKAFVFLSETLEPDAQIDPAMIAGAKLQLRDADGKETDLTLEKGEHALTVATTGGGTRLIHGIVDLGVSTRESDKPYILVYHPKTILGDAWDGSTVGRVPVEIVPTGKEGSLRLKLLVEGKPVADAEITVLLPDGTSSKMKTDAQGLTDVLTQKGRYGAWARYWQSAPGERDGKKYDEIRHYATLVFDAGKGPPAQAAVPKPPITAVPFAKMPEAASSFGAVASDGWLYLYGGHIVATHSYSTEAVSGKFSRLKLSDGTWEELPGGPHLQGMNLAAYHGKIYRVGGMEPHNKAGEPDDLHSVADCARFDPATKTWDSLPPMPEARSSHDVVILGDTLVVVGGWNLRGSEETHWMDTMLTLDLSAEKPVWKTLPQPFKCRALIAAGDGNKMFIIGGFNEDEEVLRNVEIFDLASGKWATAPQLPGGEKNGFGPAACLDQGRLYVSLADGGLYRLENNAWKNAGQSTPRIVHRLASDGKGRLLVIGGATDHGNSDSIEVIMPATGR